MKRVESKGRNWKTEAMLAKRESRLFHHAGLCSVRGDVTFLFGKIILFTQ